MRLEEHPNVTPPIISEPDEAVGDLDISMEETIVDDMEDVIVAVSMSEEDRLLVQSVKVCLRTDQAQIRCGFESGCGGRRTMRWL